MSNIRITQEHVQSIMDRTRFFVQSLHGKTTVVTATLPNGFILVESSSCVDSENYDEKLGFEICKKRIEDKIWYLEGYVLQSGITPVQYHLYDKVEQIARICHEANRAYCQALGDDSQPKWEDAPTWQKDSAMKGVHFHLTNENTTPADSHNSWLKQKEEEGWKYGPVKDPEKKEHPCFVPYEELPAEQRAKDYIFKAIVETFK